MSASKGTSPDRIIVSSTGNTLSTVTANIADTAFIDEVTNANGLKIYIMNVPLEMANAAVLSDENAIWLHTVDDSNTAITYTGTANGTITLGWGSPFSSPGTNAAPVTSRTSTTDANALHACHYSFISDNSSQTWSDGSTGNFHMYGGMMQFRDTNDTDAPNGLYAIDFMEGFELIQCNVEHWGGGTFNGNVYRIQESVFRSSDNIGFRPLGGSTNFMNDIQFHDNDVVFDLQNYSSSMTMSRVRLRGNGIELDANGYSGTLTLVDSDTITLIDSNISIGNTGAIIESNSYNVSFVDNAGNAITDARALVYQKSSDGAVVYGSEMITTYPEVIVTRNTYNVDNELTPLSAGNFAIRARRYQSNFIDIEKIPGEVGIVDQFLLLDNQFTVLTEANAANIANVVIDSGNLQLDLSNRVTSITPSELYDHLHAVQAGSGNVNIPELFRTKDGANYTMPSNYSLNDQQKLDLSGGQVVTGRYVPVTITGLIEGANCAVIRDPGNTQVQIGFGTVEANLTAITLTTTFSAVETVSVRARLAGRKDFTTLVSLGATGVTVSAASQFTVDGEFTP